LSREHFPEQLEAYKRRYAGSAFVSGAYRERMAALVDQICKEFKLGKRYSYYEEAAREAAGLEPAGLAGAGSEGAGLEGAGFERAGLAGAGLERSVVEMQPWLPFARESRCA
jgi:hypothetical protein